jgi:hypothetical protein
MTDEFRCAGCGASLAEDQTVLRLSVGTVRDEAFSHLLLRPDAFLHAGVASAGPWGDEPNDERWCVTTENIEKALWLLHLHGKTGASGLYGGE